jgi:hypothetical protein
VCIPLFSSVCPVLTHFRLALVFTWIRCPWRVCHPRHSLFLSPFSLDDPSQYHSCYLSYTMLLFSSSHSHSSSSHSLRQGGHPDWNSHLHRMGAWQRSRTAHPHHQISLHGAPRHGRGQSFGASMVFHVHIHHPWAMTKWQ